MLKNSYTFLVFLTVSVLGEASLYAEESKKVEYERNTLTPPQGLILININRNKGEKYSIRTSEGREALCLTDTRNEAIAAVRSNWNADLSEDTEIDASVKLVSSTKGSACCIYFADGEYYDILCFYPDKLSLEHSDISCPFNTTDTFHDYKIKIHNLKIRVFADGRKVLDGFLKKGPCFDMLTFGSVTLKGMATSLWSNFKFSYFSKNIAGGEITYDDLWIIELNEKAMNFSDAQKFSDGRLWLSHSIGQHMVDESHVQYFSTDGGKSWQKPEFEISSPARSLQLPDESVVAFNLWQNKPIKKHIAKIFRHSSPTEPAKIHKAEIMLPWAASFYPHTIYRLKDGRLLVVCFGTAKGTKKSRTFCVESKDDGKTWNYLSLVAYDEDIRPEEGYNEACLVELDNGDILCLVRTGNPGPLMQVRSTDGGKTWSKPKKIMKFGVDPGVIKLTDGTLVAASGRPGIYLLVDFTGTGEHWQKVDIYDGPGSSYTTLLEVAPQKVLMFYDESAFTIYPGPGALNRVMLMEMTITKSDGVNNHALSKKTEETS